MIKNMAVLDDNGKVLNIICCDIDEVETTNLISYTDENPAHINGDYFDGFFYPEQPFPSWRRNQGIWISPKPKPESEGLWHWDEEAQEWQD
jgi:hypothetical protein